MSVALTNIDSGAFCLFPLSEIYDDHTSSHTCQVSPPPDCRLILDFKNTVSVVVVTYCFSPRY